MVNSEKRHVASEMITKYLSLEITSDELSDDFPRDKSDPALGAIWENLWAYCDDMYSHKAEGKHQLPEEDRELFERCALFLRTDLEYEWPAFTWISFKWLLWRVLGRPQRIEQELDEFKTHGDFEVWPFIRREDYAKRLSDSGLKTELT
jgi:hypothetical protein